MVHLSVRLVFSPRARGRARGTEGVQHGVPRWASRRTHLGFTLIEMMAVVAIIGVVSSMGMSRGRSVLERARVVRAIGDLRVVNQELNQLDSLPESLDAINRGSLRDPWGRPYRYMKFPPRGRRGGHPAGARKDRFLVPINSRFDLYSMGPDGDSKPPLTAKASRDDVIVANDGGFIGRAADF